MADTEGSLIDTGGIPEIEQELEVWGMTERPTDKTLAIEDMAADAKAVGDALADLGVDVSKLQEDVEAIQAWTGEDIPVNTEDSAPTIAEAIATLQESILGTVFPVGSVFTSASSAMPTFLGTWVEVKVSATWNDMKNGNRSYVKGAGTGNLHYWLRTA